MKDLQTSAKFYQNALNLKVIDQKEYPDAFMIYMTDGEFILELMQIKESFDFEVDRRVNHIAFYTDDFENDLKRHQAMKIVDRVLLDFGLYFIIDPDGHSIEIIRNSECGIRN